MKMATWYDEQGNLNGLDVCRIESFVLEKRPQVLQLKCIVNGGERGYLNVEAIRSILEALDVPVAKRARVFK